MSLELLVDEMNETIEAGEHALLLLKKAQAKLKHASSLSLADLFGAGALSAMIKRSKMCEAQSIMEDAKIELRLFQQELMLVEIPGNLSLEVKDFLVFADVFFEGFMADYLVPAKLTYTKEQIAEAIGRVERILQELK